MNLNLISKPQCQLNQARVVNLRSDLSERAGGRCGHGAVRLTELHPVEQVEDLRSELQVEALVDARSFEEREVEIVDARSSHACVASAFVAQCIGGRHSEAAGIEPLIQTI